MLEEISLDQRENLDSHAGRGARSTIDRLEQNLSGSGATRSHEARGIDAGNIGSSGPPSETNGTATVDAVPAGARRAVHSNL
jgi:hypothetical protein